MADAADPADTRRTVAECGASFANADVLINNAGVGMRLISQAFATVPT